MRHSPPLPPLPPRRQQQNEGKCTSSNENIHNKESRDVTPHATRRGSLPAGCKAGGVERVRTHQVRGGRRRRGEKLTKTRNHVAALRARGSLLRKARAAPLGLPESRRRRLRSGGPSCTARTPDRVEQGTTPAMEELPCDTILR
ncbi:hypothetical protein MTO96_036195 [Rhipicephalus appendiculatus]